MEINKLIENKLCDIKLYHGSPNNSLTSLDIGVEFGSGDLYGRGIYLTSDINEAKIYAKDSGTIYEIKLDNNLNLFNLNDNISLSIKNLLKANINSFNNSIINSIVRFNRKQFIISDKDKSYEFYQNCVSEYKSKDNYYMGNYPKVQKDNDQFIITYSDYSNIVEAIDNLTGNNLYNVFTSNKDPQSFVDIIVKSGYNGIIVDKWYIIYNKLDSIHIINKSKKEEASRNELLVLAKSQTKTRYEKSAGYKGFSIVDIDTSMLLRDDTMTITCNVGKYYDTIQLMDVLIWIQMESEQNPANQVNTKSITAALMEAIDALEIKVDCTCPDWKYRFAYQASVLGYKYGKLETRPANKTNPKNYGSLCKHEISILSNKKWLQQVTGTIMDWIVKNIDDVNKYLRPKPGMELTLPNELARQNAKKGFYTKLFKNVSDDVNETDENNSDKETDNQSDKVDSKEDNIDNNENKDAIQINNNTEDLKDAYINNDNQNKEGE